MDEEQLPDLSQTSHFYIKTTTTQFIKKITRVSKLHIVAYKNIIKSVLSYLLSINPYINSFNNLIQPKISHSTFPSKYSYQSKNLFYDFTQLINLFLSISIPLCSCLVKGNY